MHLPRRVIGAWFGFLVVAGVLASVAVYYGAWSYRETHHFKIVFLNIGQGDSALIQFANGQKMLVDCGPNAAVLEALGRNLPFYDRRIDYLIATHPDLDHYGGCVDIVKRYTLGEIITNGKSKDRDPYFQTWDALRWSSGAKLKNIDGHEIWSIASTSLEFFSPDHLLPLDAATDDSNNYSIVFRLKDGTNSYLFTGDMEVPLEDALIKHYCPSSTATTSLPCPALQSNILKVGHHGSKSSTSAELLAAVQPKTAIISVGKNNYGHPSLRVIKRLERAGVVILRTDNEGDILLQ
jgi:competence protein ComEC